MMPPMSVKAQRITPLRQPMNPAPSTSTKTMMSTQFMGPPRPGRVPAAPTPTRPL